MTKTEKIPIAELRKAVQLRAKTEPQVVTDYVRALERGDTLPPIRVVRCTDGSYIVADGNHRVLAYLELGRETIEAEVTVGDENDANLVAIQGNANHGLRYTTADKNRIVRWALMQWGNKSDRHIEKQLGGVVSQPFISKVRKDMSGVGSIAEPNGKAPTTKMERRYKAAKAIKTACVAIVDMFSTAGDDEDAKQCHLVIFDTLRELGQVWDTSGGCHLAWMLPDSEPTVTPEADAADDSEAETIIETTATVATVEPLSLPGPSVADDGDHGDDHHDDGGQHEEKPKRSRGRPPLPGRLEFKGKKWWIVDAPHNAEPMGPYGSRPEAADDLKGLRRTWREMKKEA